MVIAKKFAQLVATVLLVTMFAALLLELVPGDPVSTLAPLASDEQREELRQELELDESFVTRYVSWLGAFATGDMGNYYTVGSERPVSDRLWSSLPVSLLLMLYAQVLALMIAIPVGRAHGVPQRQLLRPDVEHDGVRDVGHPQLRAGLRAPVLPGRRSWLVPEPGATPSPGETFVEHLQYMILPTITLAVGQIAIYMRLLRTDMIATLQQDFILMAKAKGLKSRRVLFKHALRPSSLTLLTVAGLNIGTLIGGALIVEVVFSLPGMGLMLFEAIGRLQLVAFQSMVAVIAILYVLVNFVVDILYTVLDPRIRHARSS